MRSITLLLFAALGGISIIQVGASPGAALSSALSSLMEAVCKQLSNIALQLTGTFDPTAIRSVLDNTCKVEDIQYPQLFIAILTAAKKREIPRSDAFRFLHRMTVKNPSSPFGPYMHCFSNIAAVLIKLEDTEINQQLSNEDLQANVRSSLEELTMMHSQKVSKTLSEKIAPPLTELLAFNGENPNNVAAKLVRDVLEDSQIYTALCDAFSDRILPPAGEAWPVIKEILESVEN